MFALLYMLVIFHIYIHDTVLATRGTKFKMVLKKVDNRIRVLIENGVQKKQRSLFVVVGDKGKDQVSCTIFARPHFLRLFGVILRSARSDRVYKIQLKIGYNVLFSAFFSALL